MVIMEKSIAIDESMFACKNSKDCVPLQTSILPNGKLQARNMTDPNEEIIIPTTAIPIKIKSIKDPYIMRAHEINKYADRVDTIVRKLWTFVKTNKIENDTKDAKIGDMVLIQCDNYKNEVEFPTFICRGLITYIKKKDGMYYILLVDHGTSVELTRDKFCVISQDAIPDKYLSKIVGVNNILPIHIKKTVPNGLNDSNSSADIVTEWSEEATQFVKDLLVASEMVYFNHLLTDIKNGREYGEFYLIIDDNVVSLSKALIINYYATPFEKDTLQLIETSNHIKHEENKKEHVIRIKLAANRNKSIRDVDEINDTLKKFHLSEKILIHATKSCGVLNDVSDLGYPRQIHEGWNIYTDHSSRPRKLQSYIWPAINKGLNVVAIGSSQCGKTSGLIMAVCGLVARHQNDLSHSKTQPLALILCSSAFEVINVHSICMSFLYALNIRSVAALTGKTDRSVAATIYTGCHILITTPRYLVRFLNDNKDLLSFDRLFCLVLDNADVIFNKYYNSVGELFKKHKIIQNREPQGDNRPILQIIISATNWTPDIKKFVSLAMCNPYICIASFLEAVIFKSVHPKLYMLRSTCKNQKIADLLENDYMLSKTMIICINAEEAEELNVFLCSHKKKTLLVHEKMKFFDIQALRENWKACVRGLYPVLICTDAVLSELNLTNIQWLIHHSVQLKLKNQFNFRFSVLLDDLMQDTTNCKVSIMIDETNNLQLPSIIRMMQRMKVVINPQLLENIERMIITLEKDKKNYGICENVKSFGFCQEQNVCVFRHCILPEIDVPITNIQINDKVKLIIMFIHDATHFSARIIEHIPRVDKSKKITFSNVEYMQSVLKIQQYYQNIENRKMSISTNVGDICVLEQSIDLFRRVEIRRIRYDRSTSEDVKFVDVRCIDSGVIHEAINAAKLLYIPDELSNLPTHTVEIFIANVAPCDEEYMWNRYINETAHKWFAENLDERSYIIGKVRLHLGNTIWLDDLEVGTKLIGHADLIGCSLKKELIGGHFAISNDRHIPDLLKLCKHSGIEINQDNISLRIDRQSDQSVACTDKLYERYGKVKEMKLARNGRIFVRCFLAKRSI